MVFSQLPSSLQDVLLMNYNQLGKILLIFFILGTSWVYRIYFKEKQKETIFISIGIMRLLFDKLSLVLLWITPLFILFLSPTYDLWEFFILFFFFFTIAVTIFGLFMGLDLFKIGILGMVSKLGVNIDPATTKFFKKVTKGGYWK